MAFSYDSEALATSSLYRARFQLGDTDSARPLLQDAEITGMIAVYGDAEGVAQLADGLVSKYAQEPDEYEDEGGVKVKWSYKVKIWQDLAKRLRAGEAKVDPEQFSAYAIAPLSGPDVSGVRP